MGPLVVNIRKLQINYEVRYSYSPLLNSFINSFPSEHRKVRVDNVVMPDGSTKEDWVRIIRDIQIGNLIVFLIDNGIEFKLENLTSAELKEIKREYLERQERIRKALKSKEESLDVTDEDYSFMKLPPYEYQKKAVKFFEINNGVSILGDAPGVGKSCSSISYATKHNKKTLIICPSSLKFMWRDEVAKFTTEKAHIFRYYPTKRSKEVNHSKEDALFHVINYEGLSSFIKLEYKHVCEGTKMDPKTKSFRKCGTEIINLTKKMKIPCPSCAGTKFKSRIHGVQFFKTTEGEFLDPDDYDLVVIDEFHRMKNPQTDWTQIIKRSLSTIPEKLLLSGTAIKSRPIELFVPLNFLDPKTWNDRHAFAKRFCLDKSAPVLMSDFTEKEIKDVKIGDKIVAWERKKRSKLNVRTLCEAEVLNILIKKDDLYEVSFNDGRKIRCTLDHQWLNGVKNSAEYITPSVGRKIVTVDGNVQCEEQETENYKLGYLIGSFMGDGHCSKEEVVKTYAFKKTQYRYVKHHRVGFASKDEIYYDRVVNYCKHFNLNFNSRYKPEENMHVIWANNIETYDFFNRDIKNIEDVEFWKGFIGGMYDAEGSYTVIAQDKSINRPTFELIEKGLNILGFKHTSDPRVIRLLGGRKMFMNFWKTTRPILKRKLKRFFFNVGGKFLTDIVTITDIKLVQSMEEVYTLTTTTGTYIAYGLCSKNCAAFEDKFGWIYDGVSHTEELYGRISPMYLRRLKKDILPELPDKTYTDIRIELEPSEMKEYVKIETETKKIKQELEEDKEVPKGFMEKVHQLKLLTETVKLDRAKEFINDIIDSNDKVVVFFDYLPTAKRIKDMFGDRAVIHTGSMNQSEKHESVQRFQTDKKVNVFGGTIMSAGVGITLTAANKLIFVGQPWTPSDQIQAEDRIHRASTTHDNVQIITYLCNETIDMHIYDFLRKKQQVVTKVLDNVDDKTTSTTYSDNAISFLASILRKS